MVSFTISQFPQGGYHFSTSEHIMLFSPTFDWILTSISTILAIRILFKLFGINWLQGFVNRPVFRTVFRWLQGFRNCLAFQRIQRFIELTPVLIILQYLFVCLAFTFAYHAIFQYNPMNFKLNAEIAEQKKFEILEKSQRTLDKAMEAQEIIAITVAGLRSQKGQDILCELAKIIRGHVQTIYKTSLSLSKVGPPDVLTLQEWESYVRIYQSSNKAEDLFRSQEETRKTRPGIISPLTAWDDVQKIDLDDLRSMKDLLLSQLKSLRISFGPIVDYTTEEDSQRLHQYMRDELGVTLQTEERINLKDAIDAITVRCVKSEVTIEIGTLEHLVDFGYFSLITITTVGYGDILPNSTLTRGLVMFEILLGMGILVFIVNKFLNKT